MILRTRRTDHPTHHRSSPPAHPLRDRNGGNDDLQHLVWFPSIWARTRQVLLHCPGCVQKHNNQADARIAGCYCPREKGNIAEYVHLDLAGPLPESADGGRYILGIQCNFSGYCVTVPIKNKEHETVVKGFLDNWVYRSRTSRSTDLGQ